MLARMLKIAVAAVLSAFAAGCTSMSSNYSGEITRAEATRIFACHGYDCSHKTPIQLTEAHSAQFGAIMAAGGPSAESERSAVRGAVQFYEELTIATLGVRDEPQSTFGASRHKGQMDCIDESTNTRSLMLYLAHRGLLKHHRVETNVSRGFFLDGRYPHSTAVLRDPSGMTWAIDSWYEPGGGAPDVLPLKTWLSRGGGVR